MAYTGSGADIRMGELFTSLLLIFGTSAHFSASSSMSQVIQRGAGLPHIWASAEMFMCIERRLMTVGAMSVWGGPWKLRL